LQIRYHRFQQQPLLHPGERRSGRILGVNDRIGKLVEREQVWSQKERRFRRQTFPHSVNGPKSRPQPQDRTRLARNRAAALEQPACLAGVRGTDQKMDGGGHWAVSAF
jgi:hypothetical protein